MNRLSNMMLTFIGACVAFASFSLIQFFNISYLLIGSGKGQNIKQVAKALVIQN